MLEIFIIPFIIFLISSILIIPHYKSWHLTAIDEGFCFAYPAQLVGKGKLPYKDFFYNYGPAKPILLSVLFNYFGTSLKTARLFYSLSPPVVAVEIYILSFLLIKTPFIPSIMAITYIVHLFPRKNMHYAIPLENGLFSYRMIFGLASIIFMFLYIEYGYGLFLSGFLMGLTMVWAQETGINVLLGNGLIIFLNSMDLSEIFLFMFGSAILPIIFLVYLLYMGGSIKKIYCETCWFILGIFSNLYVSNRVKRYTLPKLADLIPSSFSFLEFENFLKYSVHQFIFYLRLYVPFAVFFIYIIMLCYFYFTGMIVSYSNVAGLLLFSLLNIPMYLSKPDHSYLVRVSVPLYPLLGLLMATGGWYIFYIFILWLLYDLYNGVLTYKEEVNSFDKKMYLSMENAKVFVNKEFGKDITDLVFYLKETLPEDEKLFTIPGEPLIYFLSERENISYYQSFLPIYDKELFQEAVNELMQKKPKIVVANSSLYKDCFPNGCAGGYDFKEFARPLYEYIMNNYKVVKKIGRYEIMTTVET